MAAWHAIELRHIDRRRHARSIGMYWTMGRQKQTFGTLGKLSGRYIGPPLSAASCCCTLESILVVLKVSIFWDWPTSPGYGPYKNVLALRVLHPSSRLHPPRVFGHDKVINNSFSFFSSSSIYHDHYYLSSSFPVSSFCIVHKLALLLGALVQPMIPKRAVWEVRVR
jgi:hypothetical protein